MIQVKIAALRSGDGARCSHAASAKAAAPGLPPSTATRVVDMHIERHSLIVEFPEYRQQIHDLKVRDAHFARLFHEYDEIDHQIVSIEDGVEHCSDEELEQLKKKRFLLKDLLYASLRQAA